MIRPPQELLTLFYGLSELDEKKRQKSISEVVRKFETDKTHLGYCIERLVGGISSNRAASRIGYSTALSLILQNLDVSEWTLDRIFGIADTKMDLKDRSAGYTHAIGHHLLAVALWNSGLYNKSVNSITSREITLMHHFPLLAASVLAFFVDISQKVSAKEFKEHILTPLRQYLESALLASTPEYIAFALQLRQKFSNQLRDNFPFIQSDGSVNFSQEHCQLLFAALKKCDRAYSRVFISHLIASARESEQFDLVYKEAIEKWTTNGDENKVLERIFDVAALCLQNSTNCLDIITIFSEELLKRLKNVMHARKDPQKRIVQEKAKSLCKEMISLIGRSENKDQLLKVLKHLDDLGNVDQICSVRITTEIILQLPVNLFGKFVTKLPDQPEWGLRRMTSIFGKLPIQSQAKLLATLTTVIPTQTIQSTVCQVLDTLFYVMVRPGESVQLHLSEDNVKMLTKIVSGDDQEQAEIVQSAREIFEKTPYKDSFLVLWLYLKLWAKVSTSQEDKQQYEDEASEVVEIGQKCGKDSDSLTIFLDLLLNLLGRSRKYHRTPAYFAYVHLLPHISTDQLMHIVSVMTMDDEELGGEFSDVDDEEADSEDNDGESDVDDEEGDSEGVDAELLTKLNQALGKAAVNGNSQNKGDEESGSESGSEPPDLDDEEMLAMDERLAEAFKKMAPAFAKKDKSDSQRAAAAFRSRVADLLLFTLSYKETPMKLKMSLIIPLVELAKIQLKKDSANGEGGHVKKAIELLNIVAHLKKPQTDSGKKPIKDNQLIEILDGLKREAKGITNPELASAVAQLACFILHSSMTSQTEASPSVKQAFVNLFTEFMTQQDGSIGNELAVAAVIKYSGVFLDDLMMFGQMAFNEEYRIFRRTEAANCVACIVQSLKNMDEEVSAQHASALKKLAKMVAEYVMKAIENPQEIKPRFFATALKLVHSLGLSIADEVKPSIAKHLLPLCDKILEAEQEQGKSLRKCNAACHQICGRPQGSLVKAVIKSLREEE
ncbi:hypothetical protein WR25_04551 [Diploscapter pachys]|uniref:DNA polymerase V n=1 Tax=Diploscapter pachys TaxID=2018661 RepID=A0A2A2LG29_9BILA|nr:hypothetical protein WR25_04551 [Diploscapter pachys]